MTKYECKMKGCGEVYLRKADLKQHLSKDHGCTHAITQIQLLNDWGYADLEEDDDKKVSISFKVSSLL